MNRRVRARPGATARTEANPSDAPLARFLTSSGQPMADLVAEVAPAAPPPGAPAYGRRRPATTRARARRRAILLQATGLALAALLLLYAAGVAALWASPKLALGSIVPGALERALSGDQVRAFYWAPARWLANRVAGPIRVGIQIGHLNAALQPDELDSLRYSTGAHANGLDEVTVNGWVAQALAERLAARGFQVDVLPATIPPGYAADLVLSLHADSNLDSGRNGYKSAHFMPARNTREALLKLTVDRAMLSRLGLEDDDRNVTGAMLHYYAFNHRRFKHAVAQRTPALIVELGYLSNPADLRLLKQPELLATVLEAGVLDYLRAVARL